MPLLARKGSGNEQVGIWQISGEEFTEETNPESSAGAFHLLHELRRKQRKACFQLLKEITGSGFEVNYDIHCKPFLKNDSRHVSFSHSGPYAAVILSEKPAGIDFECIRPKILNILHKFLNEAEMNSLSGPLAMEHAHVYWGAKETIYKVYGKQELLFKSQILIDPFSYHSGPGQVQARLIAPGQEETFSLYFEKYRDYMLVHTLAG